MNVLVINAGSSSLKYQLINVETHTLMAKGICERVGSAQAFHKHGLDDNEVVIDAKMADHDDAMALVLDSLVSGEDAAISSLSEIDAVGHRIVQGGKYFDKSVLIDDDVIEKIDDEVRAMAGGAGSARGTGGMATKIRAAEIAGRANIPTYILSGEDPENLYRIFDGEDIGTVFMP